MARRAETNGVAPRPRRSKTVWPIVFGVLMVLLLLFLVAWGLGWWDTDAAGDLPAG